MAKTKKTAKKTAKPAAKKTTSKKHLGVFIGIIITAVVAVAAAVVCFICFGGPNLAGTYTLTGIERDGEDQSSGIGILESFGKKATLELRDDKTGEMDLFGEKSEIKYDKNQITINEKDTTDYEYKDGKFSTVINGAKLTFTKDQ